MKIALDLCLQRIAGFHKIFENDIYHVLVKDLYFAKRIDIELEAFELDAPLVGNIFKADHSEIRKFGEWTDGRELGHLELYPDLSAGKLVRERIERVQIHFLTRRRLDIEVLQILRL